VPDGWNVRKGHFARPHDVAGGGFDNIVVKALREADPKEQTNAQSMCLSLTHSVFPFLTNLDQNVYFCHQHGITEGGNWHSALPPFELATIELYFEN
jgi:hypothetical protein